MLVYGKTFGETMNRLKGSLVYLSGPMDRVKDGGAEWRESITPILQERGIGVLNPCNKPIRFAEENEETREQINKWKLEEKFDKVRDKMKPTCAVDLRMVDIAHFLIVYTDIDTHAAGTYHEVSLAVMQKKPVLIMCKQKKMTIPSWWFGVIPHETMFSTWEEVKEYIRHVDEDLVVEHYNRWRFLDWDKVYGSSLENK